MLLRKIRKSLANKENVPAYIIFTDAVLNDMIINKPTTYKDLSQISGIGEHKNEKYGKFFIKEIIDFVELLSLIEECEYDPDNESWGNAGDSFSHGCECARSEIGIDARNALKSMHKMDCSLHNKPALPIGLCDCGCPETAFTIISATIGVRLK